MKSCSKSSACLKVTNTGSGPAAQLTAPRWPPKMYHPWPVESVPGVGGHFAA
jgi:hypothetical protein